METTILTRKDVINPEQLVGTKWISLSNFFGDKMSFEFIDKTNCVYTSQPKKYPLTYKVQNNEIFISCLDEFFEVRGDRLFNKNLPAFKKAA
ncbi:MAG: hypothetical protein FWC21_07270 [Treponema sp.]|nr:hypothetical protein [Treponema sp.]